MADAFAWGLVGGLVVLIALAAIFSVAAGFRFGGFAAAAKPVQLVAADPQLRDAGLGVVERTLNYPAENFDISNRDLLRSFEAGRIENGLLFGEKKLEFAVSNPRAISFTVANTNSLGNFVIRVGGMALFSGRLAAGDYTIEIPEEFLETAERDSAGNYVTELSAESSGFQMWAPAIYDVENIEIANRDDEFKLEWTRGNDFWSGRLQLRFGQRQGSLQVLLNGIQLFNGFPRAIELIQFDGISGTHNVFEMKAHGTFTGSANVVATTRVEKPLPYKMNFTLASGQFNELPGHVSYDIASVARPGTLNVKIESGGQTRLAISSPAATGINGFLFNREHVGEKNTLVIESADAFFAVRDVKIGV